jgi:hypothetical protein
VPFSAVFRQRDFRVQRLAAKKLAQNMQIDAELIGVFRCAPR